MNSHFNSYIDIDAPVNVVSIALNGLLKQDGPLTEIRYHYSIDTKKECNKKNVNEIKTLFNTFFKYSKQMDITLTEQNPEQTRMYLSIEKTSHRGIAIVMSVIAVYMSFLIICLIMAAINYAAPSPLEIIIMTLIVGGLFYFLLHNTLKWYKDEQYMVRFNKYLLPRINSYIDIVRKNQSRSS